MKNILRLGGAAIAALFLCLGKSEAAAGGQLIYDNNIPIPQPAAYSSTFSIRADGIDWASAQIVLTSATQTSPTFNDGRASTASFTVVSFTALSTASATGTLTISSNTALVRQCVSGGGPGLGNFNVCNPQNFAVDLSFSSNTACNIAAAINSFNVILATCGVAGASVISTTSPYPASSWNSFSIASSSQAALGVPNLISSSVVTGVSVGTMRGGQDNQSVTLNGITLLANRDFFPVTSTAQTAINLATAFNTAASSLIVTAQAVSTVVTTTATTVGTAGNYAITSSSQGALTISPFTSSGPVTASGTMFGGSNSSFTINTSQINLPGSGLGLAEGVWFSATAGGSLSPLVSGTTYFAIPGTGGILQLALTSTGAIAGLPIVFTSSATKTTADVFTLNVPAIAGTPSVAWAASNDGVHWLPYTVTPFNISIPGVSYGSYVASGTVTNTDFGHYNYSFLGLSVTAPTAGAVNLNAHVVGNAP